MSSIKKSSIKKLSIKKSRIKKTSIKKSSIKKSNIKKSSIEKSSIKKSKFESRESVKSPMLDYISDVVFVNNSATSGTSEDIRHPERCLGSPTLTDQPCPPKPYFPLPYSPMTRVGDFQWVKIQEDPLSLPTGEIPRNLDLFLEGGSVDQLKAGDRVDIVGSLLTRRAPKSRDVQLTFLKVMGITSKKETPPHPMPHWSEEEENTYKQFAQQNDVLQVLGANIAPSIIGFEDIKKVVACQLLGGSRKKMKDDTLRRGDIHVLLLGDPGLGKSQILKFVSKVSPVAIYTSGKGSSAAGLTASVLKDPRTQAFVVEVFCLAEKVVSVTNDFPYLRP